MTDEFIKNNLDYNGWKQYQKGSKKFKQAVRIGLAIQLAQVNILIKRLEQTMGENRLENRTPSPGEDRLPL